MFDRRLCRWRVLAGSRELSEERDRPVPPLQVPALEVLRLARLVVGERVHHGGALRVLLGEPHLIAPQHRLAHRGAEEVGVVGREHELCVPGVRLGVVELLHEPRGQERVQAALELVDHHDAAVRERPQHGPCELEHAQRAARLLLERQPGVVALAPVPQEHPRARRGVPAAHASGGFFLPQIDDAEIRGLQQLLGGVERALLLGRREQRREPALHREAVGLPGVDRIEPPVHRAELLVAVLRGGGEEERVGPRDLLDEPVLAPQVLAELEALALALEPHLTPPLRPGVEPLLEEALVVGDEAVLVAKAVLHEGDLEQRGTTLVLAPGERIAGHALVGGPGAVGIEHRLLQPVDRVEQVALASGVGAVDRRHGQQRIGMAGDRTRARIVGGAHPARLHGEHLLLAKRAVVLDAELDQHGGPGCPQIGISRPEPQGACGKRLENLGLPGSSKTTGARAACLPQLHDLHRSTARAVAAPAPPVR